MRRFHLQGMGVIGSLIARQFELRGLDFTWNDNDSAICAWRACTGATYQSGVKLDNDNFKAWTDHFPEYGQWMETAMFCHYSQHAPHGGRSRVIAQVGGVRVSSAVSYHMDAQKLVIDTRNRLRGRQTHRQPRNTQLIVTHGFDREVQWRWSWGWMMPVRLTINPDFRDWSHRPCFYMRDGFILDYLYPIPHQAEWWYAGTSLITQDEPKKLLIEPKYQAWHERMVRKAKDAFMVQERLSPVHGWRPIPHGDVRLVSGAALGYPLVLRPQYGSGIRHFWTLWNALERHL